jgi:hypothetical protein
MGTATYVAANLIAMKDGVDRCGGPLLCDVRQPTPVDSELVGSRSV